MLKAGGKVMGTSCKSLNFTRKKYYSLYLNSVCLRAEINREPFSGFGLIYVIHGNSKDGDKVKIVNCHIKADCVVTLAQQKDRKARG